MRRCVWSRNLKNEEAMARVGLQHHNKKKIIEARKNITISLRFATIFFLTVWRLTTHIWVVPIYGSYRTANLQTFHFIYLFNKYMYWIF